MKSMLKRALINAYGYRLVSAGFVSWAFRVFKLRNA